MSQEEIVIRGAREHNLRNVSLTLPRNKLIVMTGVSGSGKSSLAFDTLYAEGQRRYVESLSSYARQFLGQMPKPEVDSISGLAPSISIQQKSSGRNPRSTVGTITEIYDYLRVLYARVGQGCCPKCQQPIQAQSLDQIVDRVASLPEGTRYLVLAPLIQRQKGEYRDLFEDLLKQGFLRARVDGALVQLTDDLKLDRQMRHTIEVVVDRLQSGVERPRLAEALESAIRLSKGSVIISVPTDSASSAPSPPTPTASGRKRRKAVPSATDLPPEQPGFHDQLFSTHYACVECGISYEPPSPQLFSFNSPQGMCPDCQGLGIRHDFDLDLLIPDHKLSLYKGAVVLLGRFPKMGRWRRHLFEGVARFLAQKHKTTLEAILKGPWQDLSEEVRQALLYGTGNQNITFAWRHRGGVWKHGGTFAGIIPELLESYRTGKNPMFRMQLEKYMRVVPCQTCAGTRLNQQARNVRIKTLVADWETEPGEVPPPAKTRRTKRVGPTAPRPASRRRDLSLTDVCALSIAEADRFFEHLDLDSTGKLIADEAIKEIRGRLGFLLRCGLDYLTLDRTAPTLSGGESQRIRLASQIGCGLVGVVYILDEPSIGLHPRDNTRLLQSLIDLRDQGNTVIVVEHDEETMLAADRIIDFGPGPGVRGGEVVAQGTLSEIKKAPRSETGKFLSGRESIEIPKQYRTGNGKKLIIRGAAHNNLKGIDVEFPLGTFICVTGVSGSGKSSLVNDILWEILNRDLNRGDGEPGAFTKIEGLEHLDKGIDIDQSPIGRTPRSNPATYVKLFDQIRDLYANLPDSKVRGYEPGRFSFNVANGRCEACEGHGATKLEMDFLADLWVTCPVCEGKRFNRETLEIRFKGKNIAEVLDMDVQQALEHFENIPKIVKLLQALHDVGLDYIKLGQASPTLSGGEAQRIKLARELGKRSTGKTIYLLDEPTTGLHFADIKKLLQVLHSLVDAGNTVLVVEHNLDVIKTADWVIDLGPEGGAGGGRVLIEGPPAQIAKQKDSYTGVALKPVLKGEPLHGLHFNNGKGARSKGSSFNSEEITVRGASQHNLQHVDLAIPRNRLSIFCGPSGSGKSSLAMETLYAEGQRRYVESLSSYARQFLGQMPKPRVEHISGLSPAIAIEQKTTGNTPRSTVGTVTEIYDYLRILFARLGQSYCPDCQIPIDTQTTDQVLDKIISHHTGTKLLILAPREVEVGQAYTKIFEDLQKSGFTRIRLDGETYRLDEAPEVDRRRKHKFEIVVDRVTVSPSERSRISDSVEAAFDLGKGVIRCAHIDESQKEKKWRIDQYSLHFACDKCGRSFEELSPHHFSFNSSLGWCPSCEGLGVQQGTNLTQLIPQPRRSLIEGAVSVWPDVRRSPIFKSVLDSLAEHFDIELDKPFQDLDPSDQRIVMYGTGDEWIPLKSSDKHLSGVKFQYKGLFPSLEEAARVSFSYRQRLTDMVGEVPCTTCGGSRLREDAGAVHLLGKTIQQVCEMPLGESLQFFKGIKFKGEQKRIAGDLLHEVVSRLTFLVDVGLDYLSLSRTLPSLSGGETQRIRLAGQIGRALTGVMYVLDEPTIGLHPRDNARLLKALRQLRDLGNTLILVEHDREIIEAADSLYDFGPGAGRFGGRVTAHGTPKAISRNNDSLTGRYLGGSAEIPIPKLRRMSDPGESPQSAKKTSKKSEAASQSSTPPGGGWLELRGARMHNLRDVDLKIPLGTFTCITGVSGSGKSSLIEETLSKALSRRLHRTQDVPGPFDELLGLELVNKIITVDQQPLGSTPTSNPATYTGVFEQIRELYARLPESKIRGYRPARFSFNRPGGRCEACEGNGQKCIEMHFLPDVWVECDVCRGKRFNEETLAVKYRNRSINDVLEMSIGQAAELFDNIPKIRGILATLCAIGLDYLTLGQSAATLSGGEAQRVKLAAELARPQTGRTLYILDEPTTGLHFEDIRKLLKVLDSLVEMGNTVVVIEHNLDVIKTADWIVDLGPDAGHSGGWIVAEGTPELIVDRAADFRKRPRPIPPEISTGILEKNLPELRSYTGEMLAPVLSAGTRQDREIFDARAAAEKKQGDLELHQVGKGTKMPWQVDGRAWHTADRIALNGAKCRWDGAALARIIDAISEFDLFPEPNWNARTLVEIAPPGKTGQWFLHALTGDEWLLTLKFRVRKNLFDEEQLSRSLSLRDIDDLDDLPIYGRAPRVRIKNIPGGQHEVTITIHWLSEVQTPEFDNFLRTAVESHRVESQKKPLNLDDLTPWKVLGKKWHLSRKGFPSNKRVKWEPELLDRLASLLEAAASVPLYWDWGNKQVAHAYLSESDTGSPWASIHTKRREGVDLVLSSPAGKFSLGRIAEFGSERSITPSKGKLEQISIRFTSLPQLTPPPLLTFLQDYYAGVTS